MQTHTVIFDNCNEFVEQESIASGLKIRQLKRCFIFSRRPSGKVSHARIEQLEMYAEDSHRIPGMVYVSSHKTFEEAAAEYKARHGFDLHEDARVIEIVAYDARKKAETIDQD